MKITNRKELDIAIIRAKQLKDENFSGLAEMHGRYNYVKYDYFNVSAKEVVELLEKAKELQLDLNKKKGL